MRRLDAGEHAGVQASAQTMCPGMSLVHMGKGAGFEKVLRVGRTTVVEPVSCTAEARGKRDDPPSLRPHGPPRSARNATQARGMLGT
jgi:hypothetical protein